MCTLDTALETTITEVHCHWATEWQTSSNSNCASHFTKATTRNLHQRTLNVLSVIAVSVKHLQLQITTALRFKSKCKVCNSESLSKPLANPAALSQEIAPGLFWSHDFCRKQKIITVKLIILKIFYSVQSFLVHSCSHSWSTIFVMAF